MSDHGDYIDRIKSHVVKLLNDAPRKGIELTCSAVEFASEQPEFTEDDLDVVYYLFDEMVATGDILEIEYDEDYVRKSFYFPKGTLLEVVGNDVRAVRPQKDCVTYKFPKATDVRMIVP